MITPNFPYKGNQVIVSSDRVHVHAKNEFAVISGKEGVVVSTPKEVHINSDKGIFLDSTIIELGHEANLYGENVILGRSFIHQLTIFLKSLKEAGEILNTVSAGKINSGGTPADMVAKLKLVGDRIAFSCDRLEKNIALNSKLESRVLSKTTFTR